MATEEFRTFVQRHIEHMGTHDAALMAADHSETGVVESPSTGTHQGRREIEHTYKRWNTAFPDLEFMVETMVVEENQVALFFRLVGTHQGDFLGLPATGKRIEFRGVFLQEWAQNQIVHERRIYDFSGLLIKLGILRVKPG